MRTIATAELRAAIADHGSFADFAGFTLWDRELYLAQLRQQRDKARRLARKVNRAERHRVS